jgi:hypothetical protein
MVVSLVAEVEFSLTVYANNIGKFCGSNLRIQDISGDILERIRKYFAKVIGFKDLGDEDAWKKLRQIQKVRNLIVHGAGQDLPSDLKQHIQASDYFKYNVSREFLERREIEVNPSYLPYIFHTANKVYDGIEFKLIADKRFKSI